MIRLVTISVVAISLATGAFAGEPLLSHGSPAPKFGAATFIRGPALAGLSPGTVYVIEFSGTTCAPCREAIPHLEELQRTYKGVVFLRIITKDASRRIATGGCSTWPWRCWVTSRSRARNLCSR